ncbi:hypothetical protein [Rubritalea sp.]|uniref:hypothetical protein n=1 Tax=Rubritalea sp. TaxID=2109375 RepID=UPI003EF13972
MKHPQSIYWISMVIVGSFTTLRGTSHAEVIAVDNFNYANGELSNPKNNGGSGFSGAWGDKSKANDNLSTTGYIVKNGVVVKKGIRARVTFRGFAETVTEKFAGSNELWLSFDLTRDSGSWSGIQLFSGTTERLLIGSNGKDSADWVLKGPSVKDTGAGGEIPNSTQAAAKAVVRLTLSTPGNSSADLWVATTPTGQVDINDIPSYTTNGLTLRGINTLRIGAAGNQTIDNFVLGETAADVCATNLSEPTPKQKSTASALIHFGGASLILKKNK